jgi:hypothetical protein
MVLKTKLSEVGRSSLFGSLPVEVEKNKLETACCHGKREHIFLTSDRAAEKVQNNYLSPT